MSITHRLRQRVTIQRQVVSQDAVTGNAVVTWANYRAGVPAEVLTGPGREARMLGTTIADGAARINMRWFDGLNQSMRVLWDRRTYDITSIETDLTGRREWRLRCIESLTPEQYDESIGVIKHGRWTDLGRWRDLGYWGR